MMKNDKGANAMTQIFEGFSMDFTSRIQYSQRADGQWFRRIQYRDARYGYKWSTWKAIDAAPENIFPSQFSQKARLPKAA